MLKVGISFKLLNCPGDEYGWVKTLCYWLRFNSFVPMCFLGILTFHHQVSPLVRTTHCAHFLNHLQTNLQVRIPIVILMGFILDLDVPKEDRVAIHTNKTTRPRFQHYLDTTRSITNKTLNPVRPNSSTIPVMGNKHFTL